MKPLKGNQLKQIVRGHISACLKNGGHDFLEAGCGRRWPYKFDDANFKLTGVDMDEVALKSRKDRDLDVAILGDLRTVDLPPESYDLIYNSFVLEHVDGAEQVLRNFVKWLRPGGILILQFPNRDSVFGFFTRLLPLSFAVAYKRIIKGNKTAGLPGHAPYRTYYDKILSRPIFLQFADRNGLKVVEEGYFGHEPYFVQLCMKAVAVLSIGRLSATQQSLLYVLEKPVSASP